MCFKNSRATEPEVKTRNTKPFGNIRHTVYPSSLPLSKIADALHMA